MLSGASELQVFSCGTKCAPFSAHVAAISCVGAMIIHAEDATFHARTTTSCIAGITFHARTATAHTVAVTAHTRPFEPTAIVHEKMAKTFFERVILPSDRNRLLNYFPRFFEWSETIQENERFTEWSEAI